MSNRNHLIIVSALIVVFTFVVRYVFTLIYQLPPQYSAEAEQIDILFDAHFWVIAFLFALVMVFMLYAVVVFQRKDGDDSDGEHFHGNTTLEIVWTVFPLVAVVVFGVWAHQILNNISEAAPNELTLNVTGYQWYWEFQFGGDSYTTNEGMTVEFTPEMVSTNEVYVPVGHTLNLQLHSKGLSPDDSGVNHAFWVPEFRVKRDLIVGHTYDLKVTPTEIGHYRLRCAELCGAGHAIMLAEFHVVSEEDWEIWLAEVAEGGLPGEKLYTQYGCVGCHSLDGTPMVGPTWQGLYGSERVFADGSTVVADDEYLYTSIVNANSQIVEGYSPNIMPQNFAEQMSEEEIQQIIEFIASLSESE
ncbi:MAG TPA: cytochrome c oxidase subunit II [Anaerolineae bacterium]|nr:cytochrome c oxidase subunit II [Anaerolineae bacterium]